MNCSCATWQLVCQASRHPSSMPVRGFLHAPVRKSAAMAAASAGDLTDMLKSSDSRTQKMPAQDMLKASMKAHMAAS